jgi:hypothetical protein
MGEFTVCEYSLTAALVSTDSTTALVGAPVPADFAAELAAEPVEAAPPDLKHTEKSPFVIVNSSNETPALWLKIVAIP